MISLSQENIEKIKSLDLKRQLDFFEKLFEKYFDVIDCKDILKKLYASFNVQNENDIENRNLLLVELLVNNKTPETVVKFISNQSDFIIKNFSQEILFILLKSNFTRFSLLEKYVSGNLFKCFTSKDDFLIYSMFAKENLFYNFSLKETSLFNNYDEFYFENLKQIPTKFYFLDENFFNRLVKNLSESYLIDMKNNFVKHNLILNFDEKLFVKNNREMVLKLFSIDEMLEFYKKMKSLRNMSKVSSRFCFIEMLWKIDDEIEDLNLKNEKFSETLKVFFDISQENSVLKNSDFIFSLLDCLNFENSLIKNFIEEIMDESLWKYTPPQYKSISEMLLKKYSINEIKIMEEIEDLIDSFEKLKIKENSRKSFY